ncbi:MAG: hypothetical protein OXH95_06915 [bacterium]|nr:hypothetical protein [bacterium]MCY3652577.1 hypothetical protein [bacterium]MDE0643850.1 hypothetical protein [bacterium]
MSGADSVMTGAEASVVAVGSSVSSESPQAASSRPKAATKINHRDFIRIIKILFWWGVSPQRDFG